MPELPEVETLRRGLERDSIGRSIVGVTVSDTRILKGQTQATFEERVVGRRIARIDRRGKYLLISLVDDTGENKSFNPPIFLCTHLKMRGQLRLQMAQDAPDSYHCLSLLLDNNAAVRFYDMWTWGEMRALTEEELARTPGLVEMGPEPLGATWDSAILQKRLAGRRGPVKPALLDQKVIAGVGNIYADEALFRAGIHPQRTAGGLCESELERLAASIRLVLLEAVAAGGTTSEDFTDLGGQAGRFTPEVYDRAGKPCPLCGTLLTRIKLGGRGTIFCANCQPSEPSPTT